ncbi:MAG: tetratricopeptide repeat protein [Phycisphaerae bacterium]
MKVRKRTFAWVATLAWVVLAGCAPEMPPQARELLDSGIDAYEAGDHDTARTRMDEFISQYPRVRGVEEAYYLRGMALYRQEQFDSARRDLRTAAEEADDKLVRARALVALGNIAYENHEMAAAENLYRDALEELEGNQPPRDQALYRLGCVLQRQGRWQEADTQFNRLIYVFEDSRFAELAERRVHARAWTVQAGAFDERSHADSLAEKLRTDGLDAKVLPLLAEEGPRFVVCVGRHSSYEAADGAAGEVRRHEPQAFVTVIR